MIDEHDMNESLDVDEPEEQEGSTEPGRMSQAARRAKLGEMRENIGEHAQLDGDVIVIEAGEPVVLHIELDRDGTYTMTWWATALNEQGHHRWRDAAAPLLEAGESIHTSALGGGYLIEIEHTSQDEAEVLQLAADEARVERVRTLLTAFPEAVSELPEEPIPDYLIPPEPELPPLGEAEAEVAEDEEPGEASQELQ